MLLDKMTLRFGIVSLNLLLALGCGDPGNTDGFFDGPLRQTALEVEVREGTDLLAVLSPDGSRIAFLILGQVWMVTRDGGQAVAITDPLTDPTEYFGLAWAPDSRRLAAWFWEGDRQRRGIRIIDVETRTSNLHAEPRDLVGIDWTPDGTAVLTGIVAGDSTVLWSIPVSGDESAPLESIPARTTNLAFSQSGKYVAYQVTTGPPDKRGIWELDRTTGEHRQLVPDSLVGSGATYSSLPAYSPNDQRLAFLAGRAGAREPWVVDRREGAPRPIAVGIDDVHEAPLSWTPAGDSVLFTATGKIWLFPVATEEIPNVGATDLPGEEGRFTGRTIPFVAMHRVTRWSGLRRPDMPSPGEHVPIRGIVTPVLSPDGQHVAFAALGDLWMLETTGGQAQRLTLTPEEELRPRWSPDGQHLAYYAVPLGEEKEIRVLHVADTSESQRIRLPHVEDLAWSPRGDRLAFYTFNYDPFNPTYTLGWVDLNTAVRRVLYEGRGLGATLAGWTPEGDSVIVAFRSYVNTPEYLGYQHRFVRMSTVDGETRDWAIPGDYALRSAWLADLSRVAYSVGGRGYYAQIPAREDPVHLPDPAPRYFSWSADGHLLLYLSGAKLRLFDVRTGLAQTVELDLTYEVAEAPPPVFIQRVRIIDGTGSPPMEPSDVLLEGGLIKAIGPAGSLEPPSTAQRIDGQDLVLLPGLFNLHVHTAPWSPPSSAYLYFGITTVRDVGTEADWMQAIVERSRSGHFLGPRVFYAGGQIEHETKHGWMGRPTVDHADTGSVHDVINGLVDLSADVLKIRIRDPGLDQLAAALAHELGMPVTSHHVFPATIARGLEGKEHAGLLYRTGLTAHYRDDVLSLLQAAGTCVTPTLMTYPVIALRGQWEEMPLDGDSMRVVESLLPPGILDREQRRLSPQRRETMERNLRVNLANMARLRDAGVTIATGTDGGPVWDLRVDLEMELLVKGGLTPLEVIRAATFDAARCIGVEDKLGTVEEGKRADLILVHGDPAVNIEAVRQIEMVFLGGRVYTRRQLLEMGTNGRSQQASM